MMACLLSIVVGLSGVGDTSLHHTARAAGQLGVTSHPSQRGPLMQPDECTPHERLK
jgi:hypothetical protein